MNLEKVTERDIEIIPYYIDYLSDDDTINFQLNERYSIPLNKLIGSRWHTWLEDFLIRCDIDEYYYYKKATELGLIKYYTGDKESLVYKYLIRIHREIKLGKILNI